MLPLRLIALVHPFSALFNVAPLDSRSRATQSFASWLASMAADCGASNRRGSEFICLPLRLPDLVPPDRKPQVIALQLRSSASFNVPPPPQLTRTAQPTGATDDHGDGGAESISAPPASASTPQPPPPPPPPSIEVDYVSTLNRALPEDIRVAGWTRAPAGFNAR